MLREDHVPRRYTQSEWCDNSFVNYQMCDVECTHTIIRSLLWMKASIFFLFHTILGCNMINLSMNCNMCYQSWYDIDTYNSKQESSIIH